MASRCGAVLLTAFGGPEKFEDVRPFLANAARGRNIPAERLEIVVEQYRAIGGRSPLNEITRRQARALENLLVSRGRPLKVYVGMRNWQPGIPEALEAMRRDGVKNALGIVLSPFRCEASWERYLNAVARARADLGASAPEIRFGEAWHRHPLFIEAVCAGVREAVAALPPEERGCDWIFTAHSIPQEMDRVSGYGAQMLETVGMVTEKLNKDNWHVAYQSRSGAPADPWLEPDIGDKIRALSGRGLRSALAVPVGFVCDHVEVLYDLDVKARQAALDAGVRFHRAPAANDREPFIAMLADLVAAALEPTP